MQTEDPAATLSDSPAVRRVAVLPVRDTVLFPHAVLPLTVGRESSIQLIEALGEERTIIVATQIDARVDAPKPNDLHSVGTVATVHKVVRMPNQSRFVFTEGVGRVRLLRFVQTEPYLIAEVEALDDIAQISPVIKAGERVGARKRHVVFFAFLQVFFFAQVSLDKVENGESEKKRVDRRTCHEQVVWRYKLFRVGHRRPDDGRRDERAVCDKVVAQFLVSFSV